MPRLNCVWAALTVLAGVVSCPEIASAEYLISVGGDLSDWGISISNSNGSGFTNPSQNWYATGTHSSSMAVSDDSGNSFEYNYFIEDQNDAAGIGGQLGPHQGGQNYDGEFIGAGYLGSKLAIAIVTGQRPDNGSSYFSPGDIRIVTSGGVYGLEVGGGEGGVTASGITEGGLGSTYTISPSSGTTVSPWETPAGISGRLYKTESWINAPVLNGTSAGPVQLDHVEIAQELNGGIGLANFYYSQNALGGTNGQHAFIELLLDVNLFGGDSVESIYWAPGCGNDELETLVVQLPPQQNHPVPVPSSMTLAFAAGLSLLGFRRLRRKQAAMLESI